MADGRLASPTMILRLALSSGIQVIAMDRSSLILQALLYSIVFIIGIFMDKCMH